MTRDEQELAETFEGLRFPPARILSGRDGKYNCIAWAAGETSRWWEPYDDESYWPEGYLLDATAATLATIFSAEFGYRICDDGEWEPGFEKVAIMAHGEAVTHMMRQNASGLWTSKLGDHELIEHGLRDLVGDTYGELHTFISRLSETV